MQMEQCCLVLGKTKTEINCFLNVQIACRWTFLASGLDLWTRRHVCALPTAVIRLYMWPLSSWTYLRSGHLSDSAPRSRPPLTSMIIACWRTVTARNVFPLLKRTRYCSPVKWIIILCLEFFFVCFFCNFVYHFVTFSTFLLFTLYLKPFCDFCFPSSPPLMDAVSRN